MAGSDHLNTSQFKWWHGSMHGGPSDTPGETGVHVGTQHAAREALNARIGHRADGKDWDGSTEYGKTLLAGKQTLPKLGRYVSGYSMDAPDEDHYPSGVVHPGRSYEFKVPKETKPAVFPVQITGPMSNSEHDPHTDARANGMMKGQLKKGNAKRGYFYENVAEDAGSVSAVVPGWSHLKDLRQS